MNLLRARTSRTRLAEAEVVSFIPDIRRRDGTTHHVEDDENDQNPPQDPDGASIIGNKQKRAVNQIGDVCRHDEDVHLKPENLRKTIEKTAVNLRQSPWEEHKKQGEGPNQVVERKLLLEVGYSRWQATRRAISTGRAKAAVASPLKA